MLALVSEVSHDILEVDSCWDMVMLRLGNVVLWPQGGELPRVKLGLEGEPGRDVEWISA